LIQAGHLRQFVKRTQAGTGKRQRTPERRWEGRGDLRRKAGERAKAPRRPSPPPLVHGSNVRGVINVITGGFAGGGLSVTARKKHLRVVQSVNAISRPIRLKMPPIMFTDANFKGLDPLQDDPMVITVEIEIFAVMKTLVDQGSFVDILY